MLLTPLLALASPLALATTQPVALAALNAEEEWTALALPALADAPAPLSFAALQDGTHIALEGTFEGPGAAPAPALVGAEVGSLLGQAARAAGVELEFLPLGAPLLARGSDAALAWARRELAGLDDASRRRRITLEVLLAPGDLTSTEARAWLDEKMTSSGGARVWRAQVVGGQVVAFGKRERRGFLAGYEVMVATDAGVASPLIGSLYSGKTLHLRASRVDRGRRVHLRGWLDLAEDRGGEDFDPLSPDLGKIEEPQVDSLTLGFSGVVASGGSLRVKIKGAPLTEVDWSLFVFASVAPEPMRLEDHGWRAIDVSLLSTSALRWPMVTPGAGLLGSAHLAGVRSAFESISAAGLVANAQERSRSSANSLGGLGSGARPALAVSEHLLLFSAAHLAEKKTPGLEALLAASESERLLSDYLVLESGNLRVEFPVAGGEPARLMVGRERTFVTGYEAELAPNTWMPAPTVERVFDGLAWQGRRTGTSFQASAWISSSDPAEVRSRREANLGSLQLLQRRVRSNAGEVPGAERSAFLPGTADASGLFLSLTKN
ncbi:MAG TPA: hypothetical protein EYG30_14090 [Planctomycetes bacterium]|nr:hypothetical protein [Planctomycetota bacterium]